MKKFSNGILVLCAVAVMSFAALADDKDKVLKEHFEFNNDVMIGTTMVKKGYYLVKYNTETGMMKVVDESDDKKIVATAKATVRMNDKTYERDEILTREMSGHSMLTGLRLGGQKEELTLTEQAASIERE